ncbi:glycosyltransferase family 2 protein [Candidatus Woesearchaeota archaeon]|nr:glycosyltransferase family 2 protein [Candidatus Woesearchaeota archaeon]
MKTAVIIPVYNEQDSIGKVIGDIPKKNISEIIVVNNNSTDNTQKVAAQAGATVLFEKFQGYGAACLTGIEYCKTQNFDVVLFLDGDYSDYPEEASSILQPIYDNDYDFVLGSRRMGKREKGALPIQSQIGSIIAGFLINLYWGFSYTDLGPFRAIRMESLEALKMEDKWYGWTVEMQIKAARDKLRTKEVPVSYRIRIGKSKVTGTIKGTIMASIIILSTIFKYAFRLK